MFWITSVNHLVEQTKLLGVTINGGGGLYTEVVHGVPGRDYVRGLGEGWGCHLWRGTIHGS